MLTFVGSAITALYLRGPIERRLNQQSYSYLLNAALTAMDQGSPGETQSAFDRLVRRYPDREEGLLAFANYLEKTNRIAEADTLFQRAIECGPQQYGSLTQYARFLDGQENGTLRAIEVCRAYLSKNPQDSWAQLELGQRLLWNGRHVDAIAPLELAAREPSLSSLALRRLGEAYSAQGDFRQAIRVWQQALNEHSDITTLQILYDLASAHHKLGELNEAASLWEKHLEYFPHSYWAMSSLDKLYASTGNESARSRVESLLRVMRPASALNKLVHPFISLEGVTASADSITPGQTVTLDLFFVFLDSFSELEMPRVQFFVRSVEPSTESTTTVIESLPPRLGPSPCWRGDYSIQCFAVTFPSQLQPGAQELLMSLSPGAEAPVSLLKLNSRTSDVQSETSTSEQASRGEAQALLPSDSGALVSASKSAHSL
ncbi:MAG: tetratricopeptide repeat protein [Candidatus Hydrogenedentes bacterium]|nr:tetratricopeptide repeat protein [Candidatus Hydrogenedentota bacterium]